MTTVRNTILSLLFIAPVAGVAGAGCSVVGSSSECIAVCDRYVACFQSDYDTSTCYARCKSMAGDSSFSALVDGCHDCIGTTCNSTAFACAQECSGVVP